MNDVLPIARFLQVSSMVFGSQLKKTAYGFECVRTEPESAQSWKAMG